ncbi:FAD-dependent oxidoreductase [Serpentinicella alkaliphila]|uniref:Glycine/D-amino acid oxidase-like deaminating enzyme n=1 Tax=Serpentinicella alkaliphila TaxID=1734049 RepID=A0A4R2TVI7_9FIRM|nr:FAD-dependent oxidoreductase [Serpentinicella alkaliphila]QUH25283.1 FAD-dependent oxidoreductase [Serpentinicella alkaliphila]TCQ07096.1 glycine/D-amino acid oxidase-like deaminating enzyme [Serpentinicella alkaliphila]
MNNIDICNMHSNSYWIDSTPETDYPSLNENITVDVAIVGGGMVGITTAYLLKQEGLSVAVLEADKIILGTTGNTTAKITSQHGLIYADLISTFGEERAKLYADANEQAIKTISTIVSDNDIDCDFSWQSAYVYTRSEDYVEKIQDEVEAAISLGIEATYREEIPLPFTVKGAIEFKNQAQFHPRKYLLSLAKQIPGQGSYIFENTKAIDIVEDTPLEIMTDSDYKVKAKYVIVASHYPFYDNPGLYFTRIYQERSYILGVKIKEEFPEGMYISAEKPTRSLRSQPFEEGKLVLIGGEHHKTGQGEAPSKHYDNLKTFVEGIYNIESIPYKWSAQDCSTVDNVPYIGKLTSTTPNIFVATGFGKWGMTNSTVSALILKDLITKGQSPWSEVYDPTRFNPGASIRNYLKENLDVAKHFILGKLQSPANNISVQEGEGKVVEIHDKRVGVFRDSNGELHFVDTTCSHLGCEVQWNDAEKSWDCPCHGSRFTYRGEVIEGPAIDPLDTLIIDDFEDESN